MRFTGEATASHATMIASWLTDNRRLDVLAYDPTLVRMARRRRRQAAAAARDRIGGRRRARRRRRARSVCRAACPSSPARPTCIPPPSGAGAVRDFETHMASQHAPPDRSLPVPFKKSDLRRAIVERPRPARRSLSRRQQPRHRRHVPALAAREHPRRRRRLRRAGRRWPPAARRAAAACSSRPGSPASGRRSPTGSARGGFHNVSLATTRADLVRAVLRRRRLQQPLAARGGRGASPAAGSIPSACIGGGALVATSGARSTPTCMNRTIERTADPLHTNPARRRADRSPWRSAPVREDEVRDLVPAAARRSRWTRRTRGGVRPPLRRVPAAVSEPAQDVPAA